MVVVVMLLHHAHVVRVRVIGVQVLGMRRCYRQVGDMVLVVVWTAYLLLLLHLLHEDGLLLVLAALVLEPDADHARRQARHLDQLLLHEGVGARIRRVARAQRVQLLLVEHRADARRLAVRAAAASAGHARAAAEAALALDRRPRPLAALLVARRRYARIRAVCKSRAETISSPLVDRFAVKYV